MGGELLLRGMEKRGLKKREERRFHGKKTTSSQKGGVLKVSMRKRNRTRMRITDELLPGRRDRAGRREPSEVSQGQKWGTGIKPKKRAATASRREDRGSPIRLKEER